MSNRIWMVQYGNWSLHFLFRVKIFGLQIVPSIQKEPWEATNWMSLCHRESNVHIGEGLSLNVRPCQQDEANRRLIKHSIVCYQKGISAWFAHKNLLANFCLVTVEKIFINFIDFDGFTPDLCQGKWARLSGLSKVYHATSSLCLSP